MSNQRPFAVGDLAVSKTYGVGIVHGGVKTAWKIKNPTIDFGGQYVTFYGDGRLCMSDEKPDIVCIRKPCKGNAESRAIVAMLLRRFRKFVRFYIFVSCGFQRPNDNEQIKHYYAHWKEHHYLYRCYDTAKSMLKIT